MAEPHHYPPFVSGLCLTLFVFTAHIVFSPLYLMQSLPPFSFLSPTLSLYFYPQALLSVEQREEVPLTLVVGIIYIPAVLYYF